MSAPNLLLPLGALIPQPVGNFAELWGKSKRTLAAWCQKGWIPTAFQHPSGEWWVKPAHPDFLGFDISSVEPQESPAKKRNSKSAKTDLNRPLKHHTLRVEPGGGR